MPVLTKHFVFIIVLLFCPKTPSFCKDNLANNKIKDSLDLHLKNASYSINRTRADQAISYIISAKKLAIRDQDRKSFAKINHVLGQLYYRLGNYQKAEEQVLTAIKIQEKEKDEPALAVSYNTYASLHITLQQYEDAKKMLNKASELENKHSNPLLRSAIYLNSGLLARKRKNTPEALKHFNEGIAISTTEDYNKNLLLLNKALTEIDLNQLDNAFLTNTAALEISKKSDWKELAAYAHKTFSILHELQGDSITSLAHLKSYLQISDSLSTLKNNFITNEISTHLSLNDNNITIEELTEENIQQQRTLKLGRLTTILSIALITILSLLTLSLYKNNNLRARANELLQNKNAELLLAKENAERASEAKVQFLSTITHELRTPLYAVTGLTHLLLEESPTPNQKEHLNSLKFSGEYLLSLINNILDLNKLEANKVEIENISFNLKKRINDVLIALGKSAKDRKNTLHYQFDEQIPARLKGDPLKVSQILINLIGNSIKFTHNGDIWIRVKLLNELKNKVFLHFEVEDNGVGISEKKQHSIFENFTQGSIQINRKFGGTGLGLPIVKNLLNLLNSDIKLESELNKGSKFSFNLEFEALQKLSNPHKEEAKQIDYNKMANKHILIVEDNKINQLITRKILEKHQIKCDVADNGHLAIEKTIKSDFDLILMDIHMPGISGIEATKKIRTFNKDIPIIALTAVTLDDNLDEFFTNGFNDIIPKPYKTDEFFIKINKALSKKYSEI
ncbi:response regulator [Aquimarina sp. TRL1]|uniref:response regulator n=1 Tax=Aquimarina sp. (strain TRL1) TaxID=2736252 RepID=UPI001589C5CA|nr:response regulator [Aquimarina sp. TRL1]QKX03519.1 response regulator [Aquimarina sp. TRL1]